MAEASYYFYLYAGWDTVLESGAKSLVIHLYLFRSSHEVDLKRVNTNGTNPQNPDNNHVAE